MIVLPNSFERYLASLRIFVSLSILKHGLQAKHLEKLQKIHLAEAFFDKNSLQSVDILKLSINLLSAICAFKNNLNFRCETVGIFYINKKLFALILLIICKTGDNITIFEHDNYIVIKFNGQNHSVAPILNMLKGFCFFESNSKISLIAIPVTKSSEKSVYIESEWEYLFDKFSIVNLYFAQ